MHFSLSCGATLALFRAAQIPIFRATNSTGPGPGLDRRGTAMFAALVRLIREWKRYNRSVLELSRLGDRELADIGISRSDIQRVAWNAAHQG